MNSRVVKILLFGVGSLMAVTLAVVAFVPDIDVRIPETQVRDAIEERLPINADLDEDIKVSVNDANVDFRSGGEKGNVGIFVETEMSGFGLSAKATANTYTAIRYEEGAFYLTDLKLDDLEVKPSLATKAKLAALRTALATFLDELEIELEDSGNIEALNNLRDLRTTIGPVLRATLDENLGKIPVYRLQGDAKKNAARLILKDISFNGDEAIATLSPAQA
ncbi:MAG: DUF1439 domain-containing protein, partial [Boseongicola sp.]|nr:DUF1439 domain-containing protein [Boseongicola sp.]